MCWDHYGCSLSGSYLEFLARKAQEGTRFGFDPLWLPKSLMPFQRTLTEWAILKGKGACFEDCGLGKTLQQLVWANNVLLKTDRPVLVLTPLAVAGQTVREGQKFGIECHRSEKPEGIVVANYERLHHFNPADFAGVVCDESSAIKSMEGARRAAVTEFLRTIPYRSLWTATAAPNDYIELGTSSEALGEMGQLDMLGRFFKNDQNTIKPMFYRTKGDNFQKGRERAKWRLKGHAEEPFWRWVCSWARACRKPSDLGFADDGFVLPELVEREHVVEARTLATGQLFPMPAIGLREEREERRRTLKERCEKVAALVDHKEPAIVWCHLNDEGDELERAIPGSKQIAGGHSDEQKEETWSAFIDGSLRVVICKPKIGAFGLNLQHCAHVVTFASHSYEQYYQSVRRCWRFGQKRRVTVDLVATEGEKGIKDNLRRKAAAADRMFAALVEHMNDALRLDRGVNYEQPTEVPAWL